MKPAKSVIWICQGVFKSIYSLAHFVQFKQYLLLLLLFILFNSVIYSQSSIRIFGQVTDQKTGLPIQGVNISVQNSGYGSSTDQDGYFEIKNLLDGIYTLTVDHIGYESKILPDIHILKDQPVKLDIQLIPHIIMMPDLSISAVKETEQSNLDVWTIHTNTNTRANPENAAEYLTHVPGLEITDDGNAKKVSIRGSQANQVLVLLDGVPLNSQSSGDTDLSTIPATIIDRIEIHKGTSASRFGSGALAGAINIITKKDLQNNLHLEYRTGAWQYHSVSPAISGNYKRWNYLVSYQLVSNKGDFPYEYIDSGKNSIRENRINADIESQNLFLRSGFKFKNNNFSLQFQNLDSDRGIPGKIDGWTPYASIKYNQNLWGMDHQYRNKHLSLKFQPRYMKTVTENRNLYPDDVELRYKRYPQYHYRYTLEQNIINTEINGSPRSWLDISTGHSFRQQIYDNDNLMPVIEPVTQTANETANGFFLNPALNFPVLHKRFRLNVLPSIRYDVRKSASGETERSDEQWSPSINGRISTGQQNRIFIKSGYARSFRVPTFADLFYQDVRIDGNPDLLPEQSIQKEVGGGFELAMETRIRVELTRFRNLIDNLIVWRLGSFQVFSPYNTYAEINGTEYLLNLDLPQNRGNLNLSYSDLEPLNKSENLTTRDKTIPYRPLSAFKGSVSFNIANAEIGLDYRNIGRRYVNEANTRWLDEYEVWDFNSSLSFNFIQTKWILKLSIYNISDTKYETIRDMPMPGMEWRLGLAVNY